jgi:hypothetical protein
MQRLRDGTERKLGEKAGEAPPSQTTSAAMQSAQSAQSAPEVAG